MPALANPKHERFAQLLFKGKSAIEAYTEAGYKPDRGAASRLSSKVNIQSRVSQLKEFTAHRVEISAASVTEALLRIAVAAEALRDAPGLSVARAAHMDAAKLNGLIIDKSENKTDLTVSDVVDRPPNETREAWIERRQREMTAH